ncbi:glycosyltransferase, partial [Mycobacteroides abscessus]|uniref:glycosyltransferase n=1 Tax=Mycobacteroides abscessus TaxID=36809 RepID=UPI00188E9284
LDADPEAIRLQRLAQRVGVADRVHLYGGIEPDEMPMLLRSADVVAATPWYEPFGIVPVEAMACGVPVIASAVGGMLDTVIDDVTGRLVPPKDPRALAQAGRPLRWERGHRKRRGKAGRARVCAQFTWESCSLATEEAYRRLVA